MSDGGIRERNLHARTGLAVNQLSHAFFSNDQEFHTATNPTIPSTVQQASFTGSKITSTIRTITLKIIADANVATRVVNVRLTGKDGFGKPLANTVTVTATASQTIREESFDVFSSLKTIEFLSTSSGVQVGDIVRVGSELVVADTVHYKKVFWGIPMRPRRTSSLRFDTTAGLEGYFVDQGDVLSEANLFAPPAIAAANFTTIAGNAFLAPAGNVRYDDVRGGIRLVANFQAPPAAGFLTLQLAAVA